MEDAAKTLSTDPTDQNDTKGVNAVIPFIEPVLYTDVQAAVPVCFCEICGGECYSIAPVCPDCLEGMP